MNVDKNSFTPELKRTLGLFSLTFYGVGMILGAGIYSVIGKAASLAGHSLWVSFLIASVSAALSALSYAELSTLVPKAGAEYAFLSYTFPSRKWLATLSGLMMSFSAAATAAAVALAFAGYLSHFVSFPNEWVAAVLLIIFTGLNVYGIQESSRLNVIFTVIEAAGLIVIIWLGFNSGSLTEPFSEPVTSGVFPAASLVLFAFLGFENLVNFTEEAKRPTRDIPIAILLSLAVSTILYILVSLAAVSLVDPTELAKSSAPLMDAAMKQSVFLGDTLGAIALFSTANTVLIALLAGSRIFYGMANGNDVPKVFKKIHKNRKTPYLASLLIMVMAMFMIPIGKVDIVASISSFATIISFVLVNVSVIVLRYSHPDQQRAFRIPLAIGRLPIFPVLGLVASGLLIFEFQMEVYKLMAGFWIIGLIVWIAFRRRVPGSSN